MQRYRFVFFGNGVFLFGGGILLDENMGLPLQRANAVRPYHKSVAGNVKITWSFKKVFGKL